MVLLQVLTQWAVNVLLPVVIAMLPVVVVIAMLPVLWSVPQAWCPQAARQQAWVLCVMAQPCELHGMMHAPLLHVVMQSVMLAQ